MNELKGYKEFSEMRGIQVKPKHLKLHGRTADVNRLNARVKMAKAFNGISLDGYKDVTTAGYTALFQVFLTYTAFEVMANLFDCRPFKFMKYYPDHPYDEVVQTICNCDTDWRFIDGLCELLEDSGTRDALLDFKDGRIRNPINVAQGVRHGFAHGHLTAHINKTDPQDVRIMCDTLSDLLLQIMDQEFYHRIHPRYQKYIDDGIL